MNFLDILLKSGISPLGLVLGSLLIGCLLARLTLSMVSLFGFFSSSGAVLSAIRERLPKVLYVFFPVLLLTASSSYYANEHPSSGWIYQCAKTVLVAVTAWLLIRIVTIIERVILQKLNIDPTASINERKLYTRIKFIKRIVNVVIFFVALALLLLSFEKGRQLGVGLLTSAGIVSVIIGFAAQKTLGNLLASLQIAFSQPIKIGDTVVVENEVGQIEEINLTYVVTRLWDRRRLILPITYFIENPFQNWTRNDSSLIGVVILYLDYRTPMDGLRDKLNELVRNHPKWDGELCELHITDTQQQQIVVRATMSVANPGDSFELRSFVRENLIAWLRDNHPEALPGMRVINDK